MDKETITAYQLKSFQLNEFVASVNNISRVKADYSAPATLAEKLSGLVGSDFVMFGV